MGVSEWAKNRLGLVLLLTAAVLAVVGFVLLSKANDGDDTPNNGPAVAVWALAAVVGLAGVVFVATAGPDRQS